MAQAYVEIPLGGQKAAGRVALIDIDDYELVRQHNWHVLVKPNRLYVQTNIRVRPGYGGQRTLKIHKLITGFTLTDHKDHDGLNNRRANLRDSTYRNNAGNRRRNLRGSSRFKGVSWYKNSSRWRAYAQVDGRKVTLGYFLDEEEAARAYDAAALAEYGEHACLNFQD